MKMRATILAATAAIALLTLPAQAYGPERFAASEIEIGTLVAKTIIKADPAATGITVEATGDPRLLEHFKARQSGKAVVIEMDIENKQFSNVSDKDTPRVTITVPGPVDLRIGKLIGSVEAQTDLSNIAIDSEAAADINLKGVRHLDVDAQGALNLSATDVAEGAKMRLEGAVNIELGKVDGAFMLKSQGVSNVDVDRVNGPVDIDMDGMGAIDISGGTTELLKVRAEGVGIVSFDGKAAKTDVKSGGMARVKVNGQTL